MKKIIVFSGIAVFFTLILSGCSYLSIDNNTNNNPQNTEKQNDNTVTGGEDYVVNQDDTVLFWGEGCSHCENVEKFLTENSSIAEKVKLKKIEVFNDLKGQKMFMEKVKECQLSQAGVPLLYRSGKCFQGDTPVIEELKKN